MNALAMRMTAGKKAKGNPRAKADKREMTDQELRLRKTMLKGSLAAAAPALVALVVIVSVDPAAVAGVTGLGRMGILAAGALFLTLSHLLWRRRWWAGLPVTALFTSVAAYLGLWVSRPLGAYYMANPVKTLEDFAAPLILLSPHIVVGLVALTLAWAVGKTMALAKRLGPGPVSRHVWAVMGVWGAMLVLDLVAK